MTPRIDQHKRATDEKAGAKLSLSPRAPRLALLIIGVLTLAAVIIVVINIGEIGAFATHAAQAKPLWLLLAATSQIATYLCIAFVWRLVLVQIYQERSITSLFPLAIAKLFADQALPSGGVSGALFFFHALGRRGVPRRPAFATFVFTTVGFFAAFLCATIISLISLSVVGGSITALAIGGALFFLLISALVLVVTLITYFHPIFIRDWFSRIPGVSEALRLSSAAIKQIMSEPGLVVKAAAIQFLVRAIDGLTLFIVFIAIGEPAFFGVCFASVVIASLTATLGPIPMGLGTFEAGMIASLAVFGVPVEDALTATLVYRGLSLWLPLIPGFFIIQREFLRQPQNRLKYATSRCQRINENLP